MRELYAKIVELKSLIESGAYFAAFRLALEIATSVTDLFGPEGRPPAATSADEESDADSCLNELGDCRELLLSPPAAAGPVGFNPAWIPLIIQGVELLIELIRRRRGG